MKNLIIGIIPTIKLFETDNPYLDRYEFVNNYVKKVAKLTRNRWQVGNKMGESYER